MSKIDEIAEQAAAKRYPDTNGSTSVENFYPYKDSEIQAIKQNAFADGYCRALVDLYPVVKPEDVDPKKLYWVWLHGDSEWGISRGFDASDSSILSILGPILSPDQIVMGEDGGWWIAP